MKVVEGHEVKPDSLRGFYPSLGVDVDLSPLIVEIASIPRRRMGFKQTRFDKVYTIDLSPPPHLQRY